MNKFVLTNPVNIQLDTQGNWKDSAVVKRAVSRFHRDVNMTITQCGSPSGSIFLERTKMPSEQYTVLVEEEKITVSAGDELGIVYAFLYISEQFLGVQPFWFWNDQDFIMTHQKEIPVGEYRNQKYKVRYRGWFINDEVLISHWDGGVSSEYPWEMTFEALLRLGGNLIIPGTDKNSKIYAELASEMGLWITHHHAEPLGAEMFSRVYPDLEPSFQQYPDLFRGLWKEGIESQKNRRTIWNIGFRGQGDRPFWANDPTYDTAEKRGDLISSIMREQYDMVKKELPDALFCTNLYGEIMELYQEGLLSIPDDVIMIWADNGYGKMVSRRQENHNPRIPAIPGERMRGKSHGTYYHVSFYDLQAANHITMLPNSMEFVQSELQNALEHGIDKLWMINASNIKPHTYPLDFIAELWRDQETETGEHRKQYLRRYFGGSEQQMEEMAECIADYFTSTVSFGEWEDEHAGEQFYNYMTRHFIYSFLKNGPDTPCESVYWCVKAGSLADQIAWYEMRCQQGAQSYAALRKKCERITAGLWQDFMVLQVKIHAYCAQGAVLFCKGYEEYRRGKLMEAFYLMGQAMEAYEQADQAMREREHDKWTGFYANECLTDIKATAFCLQRLMGYIRNEGDGPDFYQWQREAMYSEEDKRVVLITNMENHLGDRELYRIMSSENMYRIWESLQTLHTEDLE